MPIAQNPPAPQDLLDWYDRHRRDLPWRAKPGALADPYAVWLSEIMLQQTTVKAVAPFYAKFLALWPSVEALASAPLEDVLKAWAGLGYYSRARNLHLCAQEIVDRFGGRFPRDAETLQSLKGIGDYTAAAIAAIAFDERAAVVDGNVERVITRLFAIETPLPQAKPMIKAEVAALVPERAGDFAQAMMDLGATICTPKKPACVLCPWQQNCRAFLLGTMQNFPRKSPKKETILRKGAAFVVTRADGAVLIRTRGDKGLLAKMTEVPNSPWSADHQSADDLAFAPIERLNYRIAGLVRHVFTHFPLELTVYSATAPMDTPAPPAMRWCPSDEIVGEAFPNLFRKVLSAAGPI